MRARVEVVVERADDGGVRLALLAHVRGDRGGDVGTAADTERAALAEVVLHVDDDEPLGWLIDISSR